jgi:hypothetical protein
VLQDARPERQLRAASGRGSMAAGPKAAAVAIEPEQVVDRIEGSLLRPDIDDPKRWASLSACNLLRTNVPSCRGAAASGVPCKCACCVSDCSALMRIC